MQKPTTVRIPEKTRTGIEDIVKRTGQPFSRVVNEMLEEAVRIRRIPGIIFAEGATGRRARVAGSGIDVFEIVRTYRQTGNNWQKLKEAYEWLNESQLKASLAYADAYPDEIEERLELETRWNKTTVARQYPFTVSR